MHISLHVRYSISLPDFNESRIFWADFRKVLEFQVPLKSVQWEQSFSMQTDRHIEADSRMLQFCECA